MECTILFIYNHVWLANGHNRVCVCVSPLQWNRRILAEYTKVKHKKRMVVNIWTNRFHDIHSVSLTTCKDCTAVLFLLQLNTVDHLVAYYYYVLLLSTYYSLLIWRRIDFNMTHRLIELQWRRLRLCYSHIIRIIYANQILIWHHFQSHSDQSFFVIFTWTFAWFSGVFYQGLHGHRWSVWGIWVRSIVVYINIYIHMYIYIYVYNMCIYIYMYICICIGVSKNRGYPPVIIPFFMDLFPV